MSGPPAPLDLPQPGSGPAEAASGDTRHLPDPRGNNAAPPPSHSVPPHQRWSPLGVVIVALVALGLLPTVVAYQVRRLRHRVDLVIDPARHAVADLERAASMDILVTSQAAHGPDAAQEQVGRTITRLDSLAPSLDTDTRGTLHTLHDAVDAWRPHGSGLYCQSVVVARAHSALRCSTGVTSVLIAAMAVSWQLDRRADAIREKVHGLERWDVRLPILLVPVALWAMVVVARSEQQMRLIAIDAAYSREALQMAARERVRLLRGVTHDLKNPLGAALGYTELLSDDIAGPMTSLQRDIIARIAGLLTLSLGTVTAMLHLAIADPDRGPHLWQPTDLGTMLRELVADFQGAAAVAGVALRGVEIDMMAWITTDANAVRRILENLVSNAVKYTPRGGEVVVRYTADAGAVSAAPWTPYPAAPDSIVRQPETSFYCAVSVEDTGPGVPVEARTRIFDEFVRLPNATQAHGDGLGLAVSRRLARTVGGDITCASRPGGGSIFTLSLSGLPGVVMDAIPVAPTRRS